MVASVLQDGPRVQMILARRNGAVSGEQRDGEEFSDVIWGKDIVREKDPTPSLVHRGRIHSGVRPDRRSV